MFSGCTLSVLKVYTVTPRFMSSYNNDGAREERGRGWEGGESVGERERV